jgi:2,4-dienoyl-CoA reductase-like NADH-dependent reductase (Old Yellow Enzyme family)
MSTKGLFQPIRIGTHLLKHRVVLAPLTRLRADPQTHVPNEKHVEYYGQRAGNGGGLLITEATLISPMGGNFPGAPGIWTKEQVDGWKKVCWIFFAGFVTVCNLNPNIICLRF